MNKAAIHEAGHAIATIDAGALLYSCYIGRDLGRPNGHPHSAGHIHRGTQGDWQSAIITVSGAMSDFLHERGDRHVDMGRFFFLFHNAYKYSVDKRIFSKVDYPLWWAAKESKKILLKRWNHLERLIGHLSQPENHNRTIGAAELFQMSGCRLLDDRKLPLPKRKVQNWLERYHIAGYHQWLAIDSKRS